jgi:L-tartrate/succinate antiporter
LTKPGFNTPSAALSWALSGFSNGTVWLIFAAFMFSLGYAKTGLGTRVALLMVRQMGRRTITLGYAITFADGLLGPFTPSVTARSGGTIYPVIHHLPQLYGSKPNDPSARLIGSYIMWVGVASSCITSTLFLTALAPNLLALEIVRNTAKVSISWLQWFSATAPVGIPLLLALPLLTYWIYPPTIKSGEEVPKWAAQELEKMGPMSRQETILAILVVLALILWVLGDRWVDPTTAALVVICGMMITGVVSWDDLMKNTSAWNTLIWFATLVTLAGGLGKVGFVSWFAGAVGSSLSGLPVIVAMIVLLLVFFLSHYLFASITAHTTALLPVILVLGMSVPDMPIRPLALLTCMTLGLMGVITPYASGHSPVYYGSGYLPSPEFWRMGTIFGAIFLAVLLLVGVPWVMAID